MKTLLLAGLLMLALIGDASPQKGTKTISGFGISNYMSGDGHRILANCSVTEIGIIKECSLTKDTMLGDLIAELRARENDACKHDSTTIPQKQQIEK